MPDASGHTTPPHTPKPGRLRRRRRWLKALLWTVAVLLITAGVGLWLVTRSWFIIQQVQPELQRRLGGPVTIADAAYQGGGRFVFRGVVVRAPGQPGPAGEVLRADRIELGIDPKTLIGLSPTVRELRVDGVRLRFSEDERQPNRFSFMSLDPDWTVDDKHEPALPPTVEIQNLIVEVGTHNGDRYTKGGSRRLAGQMHPSPDQEHWINYVLAEVDGAGAGMGDDGLHVKGQWNIETSEHESRLDDLELDDETFAMCPQIVRDWWQRMDLVGRVNDVAFAWNSEDLFVVRAGIEEVGLTIPVKTSDLWARYRAGVVEATPGRPRLHVSSGTIELNGSQFTLDVRQGEFGSSDTDDDVVSVPYLFRLTIPSLPEIDWERREQWLAEALEMAPFEMEFELTDFSVASDDAFAMPAVDLPRVVAEALQRFQMTGWVLDTRVEVTRGSPVEQADGSYVAQPEHWHGQAYINNASCMYENFPYPLEDVEAFLKFDDNAVNLEYLYGYGSEHTRIRISGDIAPPSEQAAINLKVQADGVPLDDQLRQALRPQQQAVFDALLHEPSFERLREAGLIPGEQTVNEAVQQREAMIAAMSELRREIEEVDATEAETDPRLASMRRELVRLNRIIDAGAFTLGGRVDLNLNIERNRGPRQPVHVTGEMTLHEGGLVYEKFPYPLHVDGGGFNWKRDRIEIVEHPQREGITFTTPGGGGGRVTGAVLFSSASSTGRVEPQLSIQVMGDRLNETLYAAIPSDAHTLVDAPPGGSDGADDGAAGGPAKAAPRTSAGELLRALGLRGALDYNGMIGVDDQGRIDFGFLVQVHDAIASPGAELAEVIGESGLFWPEGFDIEDVQAELWVSRDAIELRSLTGRHDHGSVSAQGQMELAARSPKVNMQVDFIDLPVGAYLVDLAPREGVERARALWERYSPSGSFDATLRYDSTDATTDAAVLHLRPKQLSAVVDQQTVQFNRVDGSLMLTEGQVRFDELGLALACAGRDEGLMRLNGSYGVQRGNDTLELHGTWAAGELASPIVTEAMRLIGAEREAEQFRAFQPAGSFDAEFSYRSPRNGEPHQYKLVMHPDTVDAHVNDTTVRLAIDPESAVIVKGGVVLIDNVTGTLGDGAFATTGSALIGDDKLDINLFIDYRGQLSHRDVQAILPQPARDALAAVAFSDGPDSHLRDAELRLTRIAGEDDAPNDDDRTGRAWATTFTGVVETDDASFRGGVPFDRVNGAFDVNVAHVPGQRPEVSISAIVPELRVYENSMTDAEAEIELVADDKLAVRGFRAELFGGAVAAHAMFGVGARRDYTADVTMAGVGVLGLMKDEVEQELPPYDPFSVTAQRSGKIFASVSVQGRRGQTSAQTGRGTIRIADGRMARMPLLLGLLQIMELMPPLSDSLNFADADFYIEGGDMVFEEILVECPTLQLRGRGRMDLATMNVDVLFRSRGTLALVGDIVGGISDQLYGIRVSGPLTDPDAELVPLPGLSGTPDDTAEEQPAAAPRATAVAR